MKLLSIYCVYNASVYQNKGNRNLARYCAINTRCLGAVFGSSRSLSFQLSNVASLVSKRAKMNEYGCVIKIAV